MAMTTNSPGSRRSFDGPIRPRRPVTPASAGLAEAEQQSETDRPADSTQGASVGSVPVFEYRKPKHIKSGIGRYARLVAIIILVVLLGLGGWFAFKAFWAARMIIGHGGSGAPALLGSIDPTKLKGEGDGRINVLVLGVGGAGHDGPNLSDTIMVMSIDPSTKDVAMLSVPRDLYVKIPATGKYLTQYGKINAANAYGGPELASKVVETVTGAPLHYYVVVDFSGFKQAIDAVGGIDINVPAALYDSEFPCDNDRGICPLSIKAGQQHMNGTVALRYARCRHGVCGGDFGRAARQQEVLVALRNKALQLSTLTNPVRLSALIDAVGSHIKTSLQLNEITRLAGIAKDVNPTKITNRVLDYGKPDSLLIDGSGMIEGAGSIELPKAGTFVYDDIHDFVKNIFVDHYITDEHARIEVQNGSGIQGLAAGVVKSMLAAHYTVSDPVSAADHYTKTVLYDYTGGKKPYTIHYLEQRFGVKAIKASVPSPSTDATGKTMPAPEIRIILGSDYKPSHSTSQ